MENMTNWEKAAIGIALAGIVSILVGMILQLM